MCWREEGVGGAGNGGVGGLGVGSRCARTVLRGVNEHSAINSLRNTRELCRSEKRDDSLQRSKRGLVHKAGRGKKNPTSSSF